MEKKRLLLVLCALFLIFNLGYAQGKDYNKKIVGAHIGAGASLEYSSMTNFDMGLFYESQFAKHFSYELGVQLSNMHFISTAPLKTHYLSFPIGINVISNILNFGVGVSVDFYVGFSPYQSNSNTTYSVTTNPFSLGLFAKLSKNIWLTKHLILEPELLLKSDHLTDFIHLNFSLRLKYQF